MPTRRRTQSRNRRTQHRANQPTTERGVMTNTITITGRLGADPDLRFTQSGKAVANLRLAHSRRKQVNGEWQDDGPTLWLDVTVWKCRAERIAEQARRGDELCVTGALTVREHEGKQYWGIQSDTVAVVRSAGTSGNVAAAAQGFTPA